jgi:cardiolipin synthase
MADTLSDILRERARAGVRVFVLYDAFGTVDIPADHRDALRASGIVVEPFRPIRLSTLHLARHRSHVRGIVIDSRGRLDRRVWHRRQVARRRTQQRVLARNERAFRRPGRSTIQAAFAAAWVEATGVM